MFESLPGKSRGFTAINNQLQGVINADSGNSGSSLSMQIGSANGLGANIDDVETSAEFISEGAIQSRGNGNDDARVHFFVVTTQT